MSKKNRKNPENDRVSRISFAIVIAILLALAGTLFYGLYDENKYHKFYESLSTQVHDVRIPISHVSSGVIEFYRYSLSGGMTVRFFVSRSSDGQIHVAFDACYECFKAGLGYRQSGKDLLCIHCRKHVSLTGMNKSQSGCNPMPLRSTIENGKILIKVDDLRQGAQYFNVRIES